MEDPGGAGGLPPDLIVCPAPGLKLFAVSPGILFVDDATGYPRFRIFFMAVQATLGSGSLPGISR